MTLRLIRLVSQLKILVFLAGTMIVPSARGQFPTKNFEGDYVGTLKCESAQHETNFKLSLTATGNGTQELTGMLTFDAQDDSGTHAVTYSLKGSTVGAAFTVYPDKWETPAPARHMVMARSGAFNVNSWFGLGGDLNGQYVNGQWKSSGTISGIDQGLVINPACTFLAKRSETGDVPGQDKPTAAAAKPPATAVAAPSRTWLIYCASLTGPVVYVSDKFEVPPFGSSGQGKIQVAFHQFLHEKYSLPTDYQSAPIQIGMDMGVGGSRRDITAVEANIEGNAKQGKKIVKTGWKYVGTLPPPDSH